MKIKPRHNVKDLSRQAAARSHGSRLREEQRVIFARGFFNIAALCFGLPFEVHHV